MITNEIFLSIVLICTLANIGLAQEKGDKIFNAGVLHKLEIMSETEPNLYDSIQHDAIFTPGDRPYYLVKIKFDGEEIDSVGVRAKGSLSALDEVQSPMKIDINEYIDDLTFDGLKKINLTNSYEDEFRQKDRISYELFRRSGIASPRTSYAEVFVNDEFIEIYLLVEQIDKTFIKENFADQGSLMKRFDIKYGEDEFIDVINIDSPDRLKRVELRQYFKFMILNEILSAVDNYPVNNYYIYHSEKEGQYHYLPWDYNLTIQLFPTNSILTPAVDQFLIMEDSALKALYLDVGCEFYNYLLDEEFLRELITTNYSVMSSNSQGSTVGDTTFLIKYFESRREVLLQELNDHDYACGDFSYPYETGDLVINEFVAKSDSIGGVQEPDGGTPDWIELYNNTEEDIVLNHHFYLSNDVDFPKKWNFETPVTIPANGYQIVWADRDVHQQGIHSSFKIGSSGGDLMLVYEDLTVIDHIKYEEQEKNKAYARAPNGTGDFEIQDHTFNTNNDDMTSTSISDKKEAIRVYPNPARESIQVVTSSAIENLQVYASNGQKMMEQKGNNYFVDLSGIPSGIYFIHIQTGSQNKVVKLVKW